LVGAGCLLLLIVSWIIVISSKSTAEKQLYLIGQAADLMSDNIYILAVPLLEEAAEYNSAHTQEAEEKLKLAYLKLTNTSGFSRKYTDLIGKQMNRRNARPEIFEEAANYYLSTKKVPDALTVLKDGIVKTGDEGLIAMYENNRYAYEMSRTAYDYVAQIYGSAVQVRRGDLWGFARADGTALIECEYEKTSTFSVDRAIVMKDGEIYAVDGDNNRVALLHVTADDFGNYAENRVPILIEGDWRRCTGDFVPGTYVYEQLGMQSGGYAAAKKDGKWGVIDLDAKWLIPAQYDEIIQDELGRCYAQDAVFARQGSEVFLFVGGKRTGDPYEDARPFDDEGFAAVKRGGKWGYIDASGAERIRFRFDDALSFGQHLAAVEVDGLWGYISTTGKVVIDPVFLEAKSFSDGTAPVLTESSWYFITLLEYKKGAGL